MSGASKDGLHKSSHFSFVCIFLLFYFSLFRRIKEESHLSWRSFQYVEDWFNTYLGYLQCVFRCTRVRSILGHIDVLMDDGVHVRTC